jgi:hypothetical protein
MELSYHGLECGSKSKKKKSTKTRNVTVLIFNDMAVLVSNAVKFVS